MIGELLRHPAARSIRQAARDLWWNYHGRSVTNPPVPAGVQTVVFVCLGNICRSPFAEAVARRHSNGSPARDVRWSSAGIRTNQAAAPPEDAVRVAETFGVSLACHRPQPLTAEMMVASDMVVVMEATQMTTLRQRFPDYAQRIFLLPLFDSSSGGEMRYNIVDPFARPREAFEECYGRIDRAVGAMQAAIVAGARTADGNALLPRGFDR